MVEYLVNDCVSIDLHDLNEWEAVVKLSNFIDNVDPVVKEVVVIHGFNRGHTIRTMVRNDFVNHRISRKYPDWNQGRTIIELK